MMMRNLPSIAPLLQQNGAGICEAGILHEMGGEAKWRIEQLK